jgi:hypothetical protein
VKTLFLATAAFVALITIAPIGNAHAEYVHGWVNGQYVYGNVVGDGPSGFGAGLANGLNAAALDWIPAAPGAKYYWTDLAGRHHDCSDWHFPWTPFNNCK